MCFDSKEEKMIISSGRIKTSFELNFIHETAGASPLNFSVILLEQSYTVQQRRIYIHFMHYNRFFLSSFSLSTTTGAAGILNHNSLSLRVHFSVLGFLSGEYRVNISKNVISIINRVGNKAKHIAIPTNASIVLSVACIYK
jgi:hypothetical protein